MSKRYKAKIRQGFKIYHLDFRGMLGLPAEQFMKVLTFAEQFSESLAEDKEPPQVPTFGYPADYFAEMLVDKIRRDHNEYTATCERNRRIRASQTSTSVDERRPTVNETETGTGKGKGTVSEDGDVKFEELFVLGEKVGLSEEPIHEALQSHTCEEVKKAILRWKVSNQSEGHFFDYLQGG